MHRDFRSRDRDERRRIVLSAARDAFLTRGYAGTKMSELASAAGVTPAALYWYFPSKDDALAAVQVEVEASVMAQLPEGSAMARLEVYLEIVREQSRPLHRLMHERSAESERVAAVLAEVHANIEGLIRAAIRSYRIAQPDEDRLVELCTAVIEGTNATRSRLHSSQLVRYAIERFAAAKPEPLPAGQTAAPVRPAPAATDTTGPDTDPRDSASQSGSQPTNRGESSAEGFPVATRDAAHEHAPGLSQRLSIRIEPIPSNGLFTDLDAAMARKLVEVAVSEFAARGYGGTTTRRISSRAGLSSTALYAHFKSKEELLYRISLSGHERLLSVLRGSLDESADTLSSFLSVVGTFVRFHVDHSTVVRVIQYELRELSSTHMSAIAIIRRGIDNLIRAGIEAGNGEGLFRCGDVAGTALAIESLAIDVGRWHDAESTPTARRALVNRYLMYALALVGAHDHVMDLAQASLPHDRQTADMTDDPAPQATGCIE